MTTTPDAARGAPRPRRGVLAFDVGGTDTKSALVGADGRVLGSAPHADAARRRATRPEAVVAHVAALAAGISTMPTRACSPSRPALRVPGLVDEERGVGIFASNLGWRDAPIRDLAEAALGLPVAFGHDVTRRELAPSTGSAPRAPTTTSSCS